MLEYAMMPRPRSYLCNSFCPISIINTLVKIALFSITSATSSSAQNKLVMCKSSNIIQLFTSFITMVHFTSSGNNLNFHTYILQFLIYTSITINAFATVSLYFYVFSNYFHILQFYNPSQ